MTITALDITQRQFRRTLRGFDAEEVQAFLHEVAGAFEALARERQQLRDALSHKDEEIDGHKGRERMLSETLLTAQRACDDIRESARREADATLADAELQAERIVQGAHGRFQKIVDEIHEMKRQRVQLAAQIRSVLRAHDKLLEAFGDGERDERVEFLPAKKKTADDAS
ncbi:MAG: DivIVA domain-containing protein [Anaeromyxobacteraceae bacterium]